MNRCLSGPAIWRTNVLTFLRQALKAGYIADLSLETRSGKLFFGDTRGPLRLLVLEEAPLSSDRDIAGAFDAGLATQW